MSKFKNRNLIRVVVFSSLLLILAGSIPALRPSLLNVFKIPLYLFNAVRREASGMVFYHRNYVQNERLNNEINFLKNRINEFNEVNLENKRLKELLSLKQKTPYKVIAARVIGRSADNWSSVAIVDRGRSSGIRRGMTALSYLGLVGRVIDAGESTSKIMLINDSDFAVSALAQRSRQEGLVCGALGTHLLMRYLPKDADIKSGDTIVTSGLTHMYPKGLLIGTVADVDKEFSGLSQYAVIKPAVDLSGIEEVLIVIQQ